MEAVLVDLGASAAEWPLAGTVGLRPLRSDDGQRSVPRAAIVEELVTFLAGQAPGPS